MKSVIISMKPHWWLILGGKKTIEVRKTRPKIKTPFKCYVYCTKESNSHNTLGECGNGKIVGEFICDAIREYYPLNLQDMINKPYGDEIENSSCMTAKQITDYAWNGFGYGKLYGWHISALKVYEKPRELSEFYTFCDKCDESPIKCEYCYEEISENGYYSECGCDFKRPIKRPPQSWCYVEEPQDSNGVTNAW